MVNALLKFQGIKVSLSGAGSAHSHGHMSVGTEDLGDCTSRIHAAVSACVKKVGISESHDTTDSRLNSGSTLRRLSSRLAAKVASPGAAPSVAPGLELEFGLCEGGDVGGSGGGLFLSSS